MKKLLITVLICTIFLVTAFSVYKYFDNQFIDQNADGLNTDLNYQEVNYNQSVMADMNKEITVALYNSGYLYNEESDSGINKDVIDEIFKRMDIKVDKKVMPRARIQSMIEDGLLPMSVSTIETPIRAKSSFFIPYFSQKNDVLLHSNLNLSTEEELLNKPGIRVGIIRGYFYGDHYTQLIEKLKERHMVVETKDTEALFRMLKDNWIQVTFNIPASYYYYFETLDIKNVIAMDWAPEEKSLLRCITLSKEFFSSDDVERFRKTIEGMKMDGTLCKIYSRYLPEAEAKGMCDF